MIRNQYKDLLRAHQTATEELLEAYDARSEAQGRNWAVGPVVVRRVDDPLLVLHNRAEEADQRRREFLEKNKHMIFPDA